MCWRALALQDTRVQCSIVQSVHTSRPQSALAIICLGGRPGKSAAKDQHLGVKTEHTHRGYHSWKSAMGDLIQSSPKSCFSLQLCPIILLIALKLTQTMFSNFIFAEILIPAPLTLALTGKPLYQARESSLVPDCLLTVHFLQKT